MKWIFVIGLGYSGVWFGQAVKLYYLSQNRQEFFSNLKFALYFLMTVLLMGILFHYFFNMPAPKNDWLTWLIVSLPFVCTLFANEFTLRSDEIISGKRKIDSGLKKLEEAKILWQDIIKPSTQSYGSINENAGTFSRHPSVLEAELLIKECIASAPSSTPDCRRNMANLAIAYQELGFLYRSTNQFQKAEESLLKMGEFFDSINQGNIHPQLLYAQREICFRLGELYHALDRRKDAIWFYKKTLDLDEKLGHDRPEAESLTRSLLKKIQRNEQH